MTIFKHDWDLPHRRSETRCPHADLYFWLGSVLILAFYLPLNYIVARYPVLYSYDKTIDTCPYQTPVFPFSSHNPSTNAEIFVTYASIIQFCVGVANWRAARTGMDISMVDGDLTIEAQKRFAKSINYEMREDFRRSKLPEIFRPPWLKEDDETQNTQLLKETA